MFLHIVAVDRQLSVHAEEKKPLSHAIDQAFKFHKKVRSAALVTQTADGSKLDPAKTPKANGLEENDLVYVIAPAPKTTTTKSGKRSRKQ